MSAGITGKLVRHTGLVQPLLQRHHLTEWHNKVGIPVKTDRCRGSDTGIRKGTSFPPRFRVFLTVGPVSEEGHEDGSNNEGIAVPGVHEINGANVIHDNFHVADVAIPAVRVKEWDMGAGRGAEQREGEGRRREGSFQEGHGHLDVFHLFWESRALVGACIRGAGIYEI